MTMNNKRFLRDIVLIASIAAVALMIFAATRLMRPAGGTVEVRLGGEIYAELPLYKDTTLDIDGLCILRIENGEAYIESAVCRNQLCVRHRPISRGGEAIACLPSWVTVKITGAKSEVDFYV